MQKIIIDTDPGCDDAMAIAFALAHPQLELLALTTVFGNVAVSQSTKNALALLDCFGSGKLPVAQGAPVPLVQAPRPHPAFVHGDDGLGNLNLQRSERSPVKLSAAEYIVQKVNEYPGLVKVVAIGPLTNLALAVKLDPDLPGKLKGLVIMGGALTEPGNVSPVAEANFLADPHAADIVLGQSWPVVIVGLDVTHKIILTESMLDDLGKSAGGMGKVICQSSQFYMDFYRRTPLLAAYSERGCCMHDATAVVCLVAPGQFKVRRGAARVVTEGIAVGQLTIASKGYSYLLPHWRDRPEVDFCTDIDSDDVRQIFIGTLRQHHQL